MNVETIKEICRRELAAFPAVQVCILYGSFAHGTAGVHSDIDLGICGQAVLSPEVVNTITTVLSTALGHETDVLDIKSVSGVILQKILSNGIPLFVKDKSLYAQQISRMLYNQADMMPYYNRILKERRERFLNG